MVLYNLTWFHAIVFVTWQFSLIFSLQNLFPIFLNYVPRWMCTSENSSLEFSNNCEIFEKCPNEFLQFEEVFHSSALEFGWICSESATLYTWALSTLQFLGVLIGTTIFGSLADKFGRKPTSIFILSFGILMLALSGLSFELWQFFTTRFFVGLTNGGTLVVLYTYCMELVLPEQRMALEFYPNWGTARVVLTMVCYFFPDWRHASFGSCLTSLPALLLVIFIFPESPLWLLTQNKLENLKNCSNKISTSSSKDLTEVPRIENEEKVRLKNLWDEKKVLLLFSILCYSWFTVSLSAFAIDLNSSTLSGDFFLNQFLFAGVMMISKFILGIVDYLVPQFERRILHNYNQLIAAICFGVIAILVLFKYETSLVLFLSITGTVTIENTFDSCYLITVESMPTGIRSTVLGICSMIARIGALLSPLLVTLSTFWKPTIYTVLAIFGFINFLLAWNFLPETKGVNLAERIILIISTTIFLAVMIAFFVLFLFQFDIGIPLLLVCLIAPCAICALFVSLGMLIWKKVQWLPGALAVQAASSVGWLALILIYIVLLVDHMNSTKLSTPGDLAEANQMNVTEVPKHYPSAGDASNSARMVSITAELLVVLLSQLYLTYMYYGIYQDDRRRQIVKASLNFAAITPMELYPSAYERNRVYDTIDPYITVRSMYTIQKGQNTINSNDFR